MTIHALSPIAAAYCVSTASDAIGSNDAAVQALDQRLAAIQSAVKAEAAMLQAAFTGGELAKLLAATPWLKSFQIGLSAYGEGANETWDTSIDSGLVTLVEGAPLPLAEYGFDSADAFDDNDVAVEVADRIESALGESESRLHIGLGGGAQFVEVIVDREKVDDLLTAGGKVNGWAVFAALFPELAAQREAAVRSALAQVFAAETAASAKSVRVVLEAFSTNESGGGESPAFASYVVDEAFLARARQLQALCVGNKLSEVRVSAAPDWGPPSVAEELRLDTDELVVTSSGAVHYTALPDFHDRIECHLLDIDELQQAFDQANDGDVVFPRASDSLRQDYEEALAEDSDGAEMRERDSAV